MNSTVFEELMTASKGDESTRYSQSPCDDDERSARFGTMRAFHIADMKKSVNEFRSRIWS